MPPPSLQQLLDVPPPLWKPVGPRFRRPDSVRFQVGRTGRVTIRYQAPSGTTLAEQMRRRRRRDRGAHDIRPLALWRFSLDGATVAAYARRVKRRHHVIHRFRASGGEYEVVASALDPSAAKRLARTASRTLLRASR